MTLMTAESVLSRVRSVRRRMAIHADMRSFGDQGRRHFRGDSRYDPDAVSAGFRSWTEAAVDDTAIIERVCAAYRHARRDQEGTGDGSGTACSFQPLPEAALRPFAAALIRTDVASLAGMLRNFYRDPCSAGLLAPPNGLAKAYFGGAIRDVHRHFYLSHALYRLDYWRDLTCGQFSWKDLAGPGVGNPFGVVVDGTHIAVGSEYAHYCAWRTMSLAAEPARDGPVMIAQLAGGFGAIAYYLLRHGPSVRLLNLDAPERIALCSYYLMRSSPERRFLLYGEEPLTAPALARAEVILLPSFAISSVPPGFADLTLSSLTLSGTPADAARRSVRAAARMTGHALLAIESQGASAMVLEEMESEAGSFVPVDRRTSGWHTRGVAGAGRGDRSNPDASTLVEQSFLRAGSPAGRPLSAARRERR